MATAPGVVSELATVVTAAVARSIFRMALPSHSVTSANTGYVKLQHMGAPTPAQVFAAHGVQAARDDDPATLVVLAGHGVQVVLLPEP